MHDNIYDICKNVMKNIVFPQKNTAKIVHYTLCVMYMVYNGKEKFTFHIC